jgi:hypothetical protein
MVPSPMHHHNNADWQLSLKSVHIYLLVKKSVTPGPPAAPFNLAVYVERLLLVLPWCRDRSAGW